eukprot:6152121-Ditylum_brightwellii.AAC.1
MGLSNNRNRNARIQKAANLQEISEEKYMMGKITKYSKAIVSCPLKAHEVWTIYIAVLNSSITYSMSSTSFDETVTNKFHGKIMPILFP